MPVSPPFGRRPAGSSLAPLLCLGALLGSCTSPAEHRAGADAEVYASVAAERAALGAEGKFTIERPADTLRARILTGELDTGDEAGLTLSFAECLEIAAENSREFQDRREQLFLVGLDLTLQRWNFGVQRFADGGATVADGAGSDRTLTSFLDLGFVKLLETGATLALDVGVDSVRNLSTLDGGSLISDVGFTVTQPILRGFGSAVVREPLTQAERDLLYEARSFERFRRTFAIDVASRYYRTLQQMDSLVNAENNLAQLTALVERNVAFSEAGRLSDIQVDQARQNELRAADGVIGAEERLDGQLDDFKLFLGLPPEVVIGLDPGELAALEAPRPADWEEGEAFAVALAERLDHLTVRDRLVDAERRVHIAEDDLRGGLDVVASADFVSEEGDVLETGASGSGMSLGLEFDLPIDLIPERNAYRAALIALDAARRATEESRDLIRADLRDSLRRLETTRLQEELQRAAVLLNERRVESAGLNLEAGRADTRDLLEAQDSLLAAQNAQTSARIDHLLARLALVSDLELLRIDEGGLVVLDAPEPTVDREEADE
jgi:outer membrane protein TolC